jgi:hypothetical protein
LAHSVEIVRFGEGESLCVAGGDGVGRAAAGERERHPPSAQDLGHPRAILIAQRDIEESGIDGSALYQIEGAGDGSGGPIIHHVRLDPDVNLLSKPYSQQDLARTIRQLLG